MTPIKRRKRQKFDYRIFACHHHHHHRLIPIIFDMRNSTHDVIKISNFYNKIFRGFRSTDGQKSPLFPLTLSVIVTHRAACGECHRAKQH